PAPARLLVSPHAADAPRVLHSFPTRRSSDLVTIAIEAEHNWALPVGQRTEIVPGASHFMAHAIAAPSWRNAYQVATIGDHTFLRDRKSTRLNSSHVKISYAVFCLKKKTKKER